MTNRDDFTLPTKRRLAQRAGGRCSKPGCDRLCWISGEGPTGAASIGVAAHIRAAAPSGKRYDQNQTNAERKDVQNAIYLCQNHAHEIDTSEIRFTTATLQDWKTRHEEQIIGEGNETWLFPDLSIRRGIGVSVSAETPSVVTEATIGDWIEHRLIFKNNTDYEYRRFGFRIQFPEFIQHQPTVIAPPGFSYEITGENMDWEVSVSGGGRVETPRVTKYPSFQFEGTNLVQNQQVEVVLRSTPDPYYHYDDPEIIQGRSCFWISGEVAANIGTLLKTYPFVAPISYGRADRSVHLGYPHLTDPTSDRYLTLRRARDF